LDVPDTIDMSILLTVSEFDLFLSSEPYFERWIRIHIHKLA